jgi:hypothetical protein
VKLGDVTEPKRALQEKFTTTKSETVDNWMELYFEKVADHMPDKNSIHLPTWMTQAWLHEEYLKNMKIRPGGKFSEHQLLAIGVCDLSFYYRTFSEISISNYQ